MKVIIAEKPSVAREIAAIVGADNKKDGYMEGGGYAVTWAFGHLIGLAMPAEYGITGFQRENLPILPPEFKLIPRQIKDGKEYKPDPGTMKQLGIIKSLFDKAESIINCCDAGREGELIFRYILHYLKCTKPFDRLWISSLTEKAIREGLQSLRPGSDYDNLYHAADARAKADWLVGINASQALAIAAGSGVWSLGRVQTPTLAIICSRYLENKNFTPDTYWQNKLNILKEGNRLSPLSEAKYDTLPDADGEAGRIYQAGIATVKSVEKKTVRQEPPLLYDLTTLQKEANCKHGFSADKTLTIAQKLYEEAKLITYPRTGSRYLSDDVFDTVPALLSAFRDDAIYGEAVKSMEDYNRRSVDDGKVTDHHAIIVTGVKPGGMGADEGIVFRMVLARMLEAFSTTCIKEQTTVCFDAREHLFLIKGSVIIQPGWRAVSGVMADEGEDNPSLPVLNEGDEWAIESVETLEKQTKPKPLHTESSLLSAMESCAKELENEEEREAIKDSGIGTPATRAAIIETLFAREYIQRAKKSLVPTDKGLAVYEVVKDKKIADVAMTGGWELALSKIAEGEVDAFSFHSGIEVYAMQVTTELLAVKIEPNRPSSPCPRCGDKVLYYPKVAKCRNTACNLTVFRTIASKELSDIHLNELLTTGKTSVIKGFKGKSGSSFTAAITFDEGYNTTFIFDNKKSGKGKKKGRK